VISLIEGQFETPLEEVGALLLVHLLVPEMFVNKFHNKLVSNSTLIHNLQQLSDMSILVLHGFIYLKMNQKLFLISGNSKLWWNYNLCSIT